MRLKFGKYAILFGHKILGIVKTRVLAGFGLKTSSINFGPT